MIYAEQQIPIDEYHASDFVSNSKLQAFDALGAAGYHGRYISRTAPQPTSEAFRIGQAAEDAIRGFPLPPMVPELMADPAPAAKPFSSRRKICKAWSTANPGVAPPELMADPVPEPTAWNGNRTVCKAWAAANPHAITATDHALLGKLRDAVANNTTAASMIEAGEPQVTLRAEWAGLPGIQARPDWLLRGLSDINLDLKTCDSLPAFHRSIDRYGYAKQAGLVDLLGSENGLSLTHYLLAVEKTYPYRSQLVPLSRSAVASGRAWAEDYLDRLAAHYEADSWPIVDDEIAQAYNRPVWGYEQESE